MKRSPGKTEGFASRFQRLMAMPAATDSRS